MVFMKQIVLIVCVILFFENVHAQSDAPKAGEGYEFYIPTLLNETDQKGEDITDDNDITKFENIPLGARFTIRSILDDSYVIYFSEWPTSSVYYSLNYSATPPHARVSVRRFYKIPKSEFLESATKLYKRWSPILGAFSYPFKYRPQTGEFEKTFNIQITGGYSILPNIKNAKKSLAFLLGVGASSITLNPFNTTDYKGDSSGRETTSATISLNIVYIHNRFQVGASLGWDNLLGNESKNWQYNAKPWLSIGVGANIFSLQEESTSPTQK
jgi:hypothetical protein